MVSATRVSAETTTSETTRRKVSLGRAAMTGGLMATKKKTTIKSNREETREQVLYLYRKEGRTPLLLCEHALRYANLEEFMCPTSAENFAALVTILKARAPSAIFDDRLAGVVRKSTLAQVAGSAKDRVTVHSNASELDLAAHLVVMGHLQQQI